MAFQFDPKLFQGKARKKYLEAQKRINEIHQKYPDVKQINEYLNYLKKEYHFLRVGFFSPNGKENTKLIDLEKEIKELEKHFNKLLEDYNIPHNYKEPDWDCPKCQDQGRIYKDGHYYPCSCVLNEQIKENRLKGRLPKHLYQANFKRANLNYYDDHKTTNNGISFRENAQLIYSYAHKFATSFSPGKYSRGLTIYGPVGSGKSFLLGCIANQLIMKGIGFKYIVYTDLLQEIRHSYEDNSLNEKELLEMVQNTPVLLIDDLGTEKASEFAVSTFYQIIDKRYREEKPIILTTNYFIDDLRDRFEDMFEEMGQRIFQRLMEMNHYLGLYGNIRDKIVANKQKEDNP